MSPGILSQLHLVEKFQKRVNIALRTQADLGQRGTSNTRRDREASLDVEEFRANCLSPEYPDLGKMGSDAVFVEMNFFGQFDSIKKILSLGLGKSTLQ